MNERIRELWNKAAESTAAYPSGQNNSWETQVNFIDKFAELIVKECADFVYFKAEKSMSQEIVHVGDDLLKHFGVDK